jgi:hypothetical protein
MKAKTKAPNWDAQTRANTRQAILELEYLSYDKNPGVNLDSYNGVWAAAQKGWDTEGWTDKHWSFVQKLWLNLLQNSMKDLKADRSKTVEVRKNVYVTRRKWEEDRKKKGLSPKMLEFEVSVANMYPADFDDMLAIVFAKVETSKLVLQAVTKALQDGVLK